jgi:Pectate lyase superfamily protein
MSQVAITGMPGYPGAPGTINTLTGAEFVHGIQNQSGTMVDVALPIGTMVVFNPGWSGFVSRLISSKLADIVSAIDAGCDPTGGTDSSSALNDAVSYCISSGRKLFVPAGTYLLGSQIAGTGSLHMIGEGANRTVFKSSTNQGFQFTIPDQFHSVQLSDFTLLGGAAGTGNSGIKLLSSASSIPDPANTEQSYLANINIYGSDGMGNSNYFPCAAEIEYVSNVNLFNVMSTGTSARQGTGLLIHGNSSLAPNVYNLTGCTFNFLNVGVEYGNYVQGVTLTQCNLTGCNYGLDTASGLSVLVQLGINNSQFNCVIAGVNLNTAIPDFTFNGNTVFIPGPSSGVSIGVNMVNAHRYSILGNSFSGYDTTANSLGIVVGTNLAKGIITGNSFDTLGYGTVLQSTSSGNNVQSNAYTSVTTPVSNSGSGNTIGGGSQ